MRAIVGMIVGLIAGLAAIILIGVIGVRATFSVPSDINVYSSRQVVEVIVNMPSAAKIALLIAVFGGAVVGAAVTKLIARRAWAAWTVGGLMAVYWAYCVLSLPLAAWMPALTFAAPLLGAFIGNHLVGSRAPAAAAPAEGETPPAV